MMLFQKIANLSMGTGVHPLLDEVISAVSLPWGGGNHSVLAHQALGPIVAREAEASSAVIYRFDDETLSVAKSILDTERRRLFVVRNAHPPAPRVFMEFPPTPNRLRWGFYTRGDRDNLSLFLLADFGGDSPAAPVGLFNGISINALFDEPTWRNPEMRSFVLPRGWDIDVEAALYKGMQTTLCLWMFLSSGATVVDRVPSPRVSPRYVSKSSLPICSFNRVRMKLPGGVVHRKGRVQWERGPGVRRHQVTGHFWESEKQRIVRWVDAYWRGQERLGLVLSERTVRRSKR